MAMLFYTPHPQPHTHRPHTITQKARFETYGTNDFTEYETVSDNEISLPFKPLTTRKKKATRTKVKWCWEMIFITFRLKPSKKTERQRLIV